MSQNTVYARQEPTKDALSIKQGLLHKLDTVVYHDKKMTKLAGRFSWNRDGKPHSDSTHVTLNYSVFSLEWQDDLPARPKALMN